MALQDALYLGFSVEPARPGKAALLARPPAVGDGGVACRLVLPTAFGAVVASIVARF